MSTSDHPKPPSRAARAAITLLALACVVAFTFVPVPGVDFAGAGARLGIDMAALPVTTVGLGGFVVASWLMALVAAFTSMSRDTAWRGATLIALAFAALHAHGMNTFILADDGLGITTGSYSYISLVATLVAGVCVLLVLAQWIDRRGLGNGIVAVGLVPFLLSQASTIVDLFSTEEGATRVAADHLHAARAVQLGGVVVAFALVAFVTARLVQRPTVTLPKRNETNIARVALPATAGSIATVYVASLVTVMLIQGGSVFYMLVELPYREIHPLGLLVIQLVIAVGLYVVLAQRAQRTPEIVALWRNSTGVDDATGEAFQIGLLFVIGLVVLGRYGPTLWMSPVLVAVATAWFIDARAHWNAQKQWPDLVGIHVCDAPWVADTLVGALHANGVPAHARNVAQRSLLGALGPFVPITILVPEGRHEAARDVIAEVLDDKNEPATPIAEPLPVPLTRRAGLIAIMAVVLTVFGLGESRLLASLEAGEDAPLDVDLHLVLLEDEANALEHVATAPDVPKGCDFLLENAPIGPGRTLPVFYLRCTEPTVEPPAEAVAWLGKVPIPEGTRFAWQKVYELDEATDAYVHGGWRTMLLRNEPVLTHDNVARATAAVDTVEAGVGVWYVSLQLDEEGGRLFEQATTDHVKRRFAIVLDGEVVSAPEIREPISGGTARITMGTGSMEQQREDALKLERALNRRAK